VGARGNARLRVCRRIELEDGEHQDDRGDGGKENATDEDHGDDNRDADDGREDAEEKVLRAASVRAFCAIRRRHLAR
jgi:hypothetical protein